MAISISDLVRSPYKLNSDTLHALREHVAEYPYDQTARLLLLYNLYLLHDSTYSDILHKQAVYLADRNILFRATEGQTLKLNTSLNTKRKPKKRGEPSTELIDRFLRQHEVEESHRPGLTLPTPDPSGDYMAYWAQQHGVATETLSTEEESNISTLLHSVAIRPLQTSESTPQEPTTSLPEENVIDGPIKEKVDKPEDTPATESTDTPLPEETFYTENLAKIYIKQGRYERAIEILKALSVANPKKNRYFADQIRFLHKLAINSRFRAEER